MKEEMTVSSIVGDLGLCFYLLEYLSAWEFGDIPMAYCGLDTV
jgi:hypothetical protein